MHESVFPSSIEGQGEIISPSEVDTISSCQ